MASRTAFVYDSSFPLHQLETFFIRHSKDVFNRLEFSRALEAARALADEKHFIKVMDIDALVVVDNVICIVPQRHRHRRDPGVFLFFEALGYGFIAGGHRKGTDEEGVV